MLSNERKSALYRAVLDDKDWTEAKRLIESGEASEEDIKEVLIEKALHPRRIESGGKEEELYILMFKSVHELKYGNHEFIDTLISEISDKIAWCKFEEDGDRYSKATLEHYLKYYYDALRSWLNVMYEAGRNDVVILYYYDITRGDKVYTNSEDEKLDEILEQFFIMQADDSARIMSKEEKQDLGMINSIKERANSIISCTLENYEKIAYLKCLMWEMPINDCGQFKTGYIYNEARLDIYDMIEDMKPCRVYAAENSAGSIYQIRPNTEVSRRYVAIDQVCPISLEVMKNPIEVIAFDERNGFASIQMYDLKTLCPLLNIKKRDFDNVYALHEACKGVPDPLTRLMMIAPQRVIEKELDELATDLSKAKVAKHRSKSI